jgi:hypothetical protein
VTSRLAMNCLRIIYQTLHYEQRQTTDVLRSPTLTNLCAHANYARCDNFNDRSSAHVCASVANAWAMLIESHPTVRSAEVHARVHAVCEAALAEIKIRTVICDALAQQ